MKSPAAFAILALAAAAAIPACQGNKPVPDDAEIESDMQTGPAALYNNTHWVIWSLRGVDIPTRADCGIQFNEEGQASGRSGVNNFFSQTTAGPNGELTFGVIGSTKMAGSQADMEFEQAFFEALQDTRRFRITNGGSNLDFIDASNNVIMTFRRQVSIAPGT